MNRLKIAIIISTTRAARFGHKPAQWVRDIAAQRDDLETEIVDLRDFPMPFFDEMPSNAWAPSQNPVAQRWQKKVAEFDGYIFVTAEYDHGVPAVLKNALDYAYPEWNKKAAGFVGYGSVGGSRAVEHLRLIAAELQLAAIRAGVYIKARFHRGMEGQQGIDGTQLPSGRRQRHAGPTGVVDEGAQDRARPARGGRRGLTAASPWFAQAGKIMSIAPIT